MQINEFILKSHCRKFNYDISGEPLVIFAIRGSYPLQSYENNPRQSGNPEKVKSVIKTNLSYKETACSIGIWLTLSGEIALFPGSTVPSLNYLHQNPGSVKHFNILCPGKYRLVRGIHPRNVAGYQRHEALIMPGEGWIMKPGLIRKQTGAAFNFKAVGYDVAFAGDNIHASRSEPCIPDTGATGINPVVNKKYSSSGCITIIGQPEEYVRSKFSFFWNSWEQFMQLIDSFPKINSYSFLLFSYSDLTSDEEYGNRHILRYGSQGLLITELQKKLSEIYCIETNRAYYAGEPNGLMQSGTVKSYLNFMKDYSPGRLAGEADIDEFRILTGHFIFKLKNYRYAVN
jgi:hypothetical protein